MQTGQPPVFVAVSNGENAVVVGVYTTRDAAVVAVLDDIALTDPNPEVAVRAAVAFANGEDTYDSETTSWSIHTSAVTS